jgi:phosphatidylinositol phospholipase C delta
MNFAGYELAKKAMIEDESKSRESIEEKKTMVGSRG